MKLKIKILQTVQHDKKKYQMSKVLCAQRHFTSKGGLTN